jgi:hypothetical protein
MMMLFERELRPIGLAASSLGSVTHREKPTTTAIPSHRHHAETSCQDITTSIAQANLAC